MWLAERRCGRFGACEVAMFLGGWLRCERALASGDDELGGHRLIGKLLCWHREWRWDAQRDCRKSTGDEVPAIYNLVSPVI